MKLNRRQFLSSTLAATASLTLARQGWATDTSHPLLVTIQAGGGWDPLFFCDPSGEDVHNRITTATRQSHGIRYANIPIVPEDTNLSAADRETAADDLMTNRAFFEAHGNRFMVVNGLNHATVAHRIGRRKMWTGEGADGHPTINALLAASEGATTPLAYLSTGGEEATAGVVPLTRFDSTSRFVDVVRPTTYNSGNNEFVPGPIWDQIRNAQQARLNQAMQAASLRTERRALERLAAARDAGNRMRDFALPSLPDNAPTRVGRSDCQKVQLILHAMSQGMAVSGNIGIGGWDTHGEHDQRAPVLYGRVCRLLDFILAEAEQLGLSHRLWIIVGSDFGRTPTYNDNNGKDHWSTSSMLIAGPGVQGGRVIGSTNEERRGMAISPDTLELDENGIVPTPLHLHRALRARIGLTHYNQRFRLLGDDINFFA